MRTLQPLKASAFIHLNEEMKTLVLSNGAVPVNDVFYDLWGCCDDIMLLYGGYGSGKSMFLADYLINECRVQKYFRCLFGRKVKDTVRGSIFSSLIKQIKRRGLEHEFDFSEEENGSMVIVHYATGNKFIPFGADKSEKLKSTDEPTHIFCDELDQFTLIDFGVLLSRLRTEVDKTQFIGAFNTTTVTEEHWIYKTFFNEKINATGAVQFEGKSISLGSITKRFCNYNHNYFINQTEYESKLWWSAGFNETKFREISAGAWGSDVKENTFIYSFRDKETANKKPGYCHLVDGMTPDYSLPLICSFDFNVDPITATLWQHARDLSWISGLQEYRLMSSDIFELCERIITDHPEAYWMITGDATGRSRTAITRGNKNYFYFIKQEFKVKDSQFKVPSKNPFHTNTRMLANILFAKHPALLMNRSMNHLVTDIKSVITDDEGGIDKKKDAYKGHLLDTMLYYFWNFHISFLEKYKK